MLLLQKDGYGVEQGIPTLLMAAGSFDDVLAITGFTTCLGMAFATGKQGKFHVQEANVFEVSKFYVWFIRSSAEGVSGPFVCLSHSEFWCRASLGLYETAFKELNNTISDGHECSTSTHFSDNCYVVYFLCGSFQAPLGSTC